MIPKQISSYMDSLIATDLYHKSPAYARLYDIVQYLIVYCSSAKTTNSRLSTFPATTNWTV